MLNSKKQFPSQSMEDDAAKSNGAKVIDVLLNSDSMTPIIISMISSLGFNKQVDVIKQIFLNYTISGKKNLISDLLEVSELHEYDFCCVFQESISRIVDFNKNKACMKFIKRYLKRRILKDPESNKEILRRMDKSLEDYVDDTDHWEDHDDQCFCDKLDKVPENESERVLVELLGVDCTGCVKFSSNRVR